MTDLLAVSFKKFMREGLIVDVCSAMRMLGVSEQDPLPGKNLLTF